MPAPGDRSPRATEQVRGGLQKANDEWNPGRWKALHPLLPRSQSSWVFRDRGSRRSARFSLSTSDGNSRTLTGFTPPPTSTRCTPAFRSLTRIVGLWLAAIAAWIDQTRRSGRYGVIACSALKRRYRDVLIGDRIDVRLVYLKGDETLIARRIATRHEHFMPRGLLHSQFEALEEPGPDENPVIVSIEPEPREIAAQILALLHLTAAIEQEPLRSSAPGAKTSP
jgi:gluconate kinase